MNARNTEQRKAIREVLELASGPLSAQEVLEAAQVEHEGLGAATVYRNLKMLVEEGWLALVELPGEPSRYELAEKLHHHHFTCDGCGKVYDIPGCVRGVQTSAPAGFVIDRHEIVLYGHCRDCLQGS